MADHYDVFLSHASNDKIPFVDRLKKSFDKLGISIFYDADTLRWGDNWKDKINDGLKNCDFGVIVISKNFFDREWTEKELKALLSRQNRCGQNIILPILYGVTRTDLCMQYKKLGDIQFIDGSKLSVSDITIKLAEVLLRKTRVADQVSDLDAVFKGFFSGHALSFFKWIEQLVANGNQYIDEYETDMIGWDVYPIDGNNLLQRDDGYRCRINPKYYGALKDYFEREIRPQM